MDQPASQVTGATVSLPVRPAAPPRRTAWAQIRAILLRLYRLGIIVTIAWLIHYHQVRLRIDGDAPIKTDELRAFYHNVASLSADESTRQGLFVKDAAGNRIGYVVRTSPLCDKLPGCSGWSGPTDTLIAMDADGKVLGLRIRSTKDTKDHVATVNDDETFLKIWNGKKWDEVAGMDPVAAGIEGVSGASLTSVAIANSIYQRFKLASGEAAQAPPVKWDIHDYGLAGVVLASLLFAFTSLRSHRWFRRAYQLVLIGYFGLTTGMLLSQSTLAGWTIGGIAWRTAPGLVLLAAAALVIPWATRRPVYCSQLCPHGAAQELLGRVTKKKLRLHKGIEAGLRRLPFGLLVVVILVAFMNLPTDLADLEPFHAYSFRSAGIATIAIAVIGLVAAVFVPMAYCKFGCPTGMFLEFMRSHGRADHFGIHEIAGGLLLTLSILLYRHYHTVNTWILGSAPDTSSHVIAAEQPRNATGMEERKPQTQAEEP